MYADLYLLILGRTSQTMLDGMCGSLGVTVKNESGAKAWTSRAEPREKGHGKGRRPRGGNSAKTSWDTRWHAAQRKGVSFDDFVKKDPKP